MADMYTYYIYIYGVEDDDIVESSNAYYSHIHNYTQVNSTYLLDILNAGLTTKMQWSRETQTNEWIDFCVWSQFPHLFLFINLMVFGIKIQSHKHTSTHDSDEYNKCTRSKLLAEATTSWNSKTKCVSFTNFCNAFVCIGLTIYLW